MPAIHRAPPYLPATAAAAASRAWTTLLRLHAFFFEVNAPRDEPPRLPPAVGFRSRRPRAVRKASSEKGRASAPPVRRGGGLLYSVFIVPTACAETASPRSSCALPLRRGRSWCTADRRAQQTVFVQMPLPDNGSGSETLLPIRLASFVLGWLLIMVAV